MNHHQQCYRRDRLVLETVAQWGTMDTEMLRILFYPSARVAQRRLGILTEKGKIKRTRDTIGQSYFYYLKHCDYFRFTINWARIWISKKLCRSWEVFESFDYETNTATLRNVAQDSIRTIKVIYNATRKTWLSNDVLVVYDTIEQKYEASKRIKGNFLLSIEDIQEGLKCSEQLKQIHS